MEEQKPSIFHPQSGRAIEDVQSGNTAQIEDEDTSGHVGTRGDVTPSWLSVVDARVYAESRGITRTQKTFKRWTQQASAEEVNGVRCARKQDIPNGFKWMVLRDWLDVKIDEELQHEQNEMGVSERDSTLR